MIITLINLVGGVYVGLVTLDLSFAETLRRFTILTIGDGLVSQIPAFIVSVSAAMIVTRSASKGNLGEELIAQLTSQPIALALTAGFLCVLALTPLPKPPLILLARSCAGMAFLLSRKLEAAVVQAVSARATPTPPATLERPPPRAPKRPAAPADP